LPIAEGMPGRGNNRVRFGPSNQPDRELRSKDSQGSFAEAERRSCSARFRRSRAPSDTSREGPLPIHLSRSRYRAAVSGFES
jgi:hypothetical protein